jgi:serine/threonine-protein kinase
MSDFLSKFEQPAPQSTVAAGHAKIAHVEHETAFDNGFRKRKLIRWVIVLAALVLLCVAGFVLYTHSQRVLVPDLEGKPLAEAQAWARENKLELAITETYSMQVADGLIITQELDVDSYTTRGLRFACTVSKGPDPNERLALPDFAKLSLQEAKRWTEEHKAGNLRIVQEYSETVPAETYIKLVFRNDTTSADSYLRKDYATLYYSKGPEEFEKNIELPDFQGKTQAEVESWAQTNSINLEIEEETSADVSRGLVIAQSIAAKEKLAKKDTLRIVVSLGKALIVPNFADYDAQSAGGAVPGLSVVVKTSYSLSVPYGRLISQSVGAGASLLSDQDVTITVIYSEGQPYLKDYRGINEGELAALFWQNYTSKNANVSYAVEYVDSHEERGTIVAMSSYNLYIPLDYHVILYASNGSLPAPTPTPEPTPAPAPEPAPGLAP